MHVTSVSIVRSIDECMVGRMVGIWSMDVVASFISGIVCACSTLPCACHSIAMANAMDSVGRASGILAGVWIGRPSSVTVQRGRATSFTKRCTSTCLYHTCRTRPASRTKVGSSCGKTWLGRHALCEQAAAIGTLMRGCIAIIQWRRPTCAPGLCRPRCEGNDAQL